MKIGPAPYPFTNQNSGPSREAKAEPTFSGSVEVSPYSLLAPPPASKSSQSSGAPSPAPGQPKRTVGGPSPVPGQSRTGAPSPAPKRVNEQLPPEPVPAYAKIRLETNDDDEVVGVYVTRHGENEETLLDNPSVAAGLAKEAKLKLSSNLQQQAKTQEREHELQSPNTSGARKLYLRLFG